MPMHPTMPEQKNEIEIPKKVMMLFYSGLLALGLIIYVSWGVMYGSWNIFERTNLGMYAVTVMLCGFGIVGLLLYRLK
jgi:hypothetical protein